MRANVNDITFAQRSYAAWAKTGHWREVISIE